MNTLAEKIIKARAALGISQAELAKRAGIAVRTLQSYEQGTRTPRNTSFYSLARALGVSTTYLKDPNCDDPQKDIEKDVAVTPPPLFAYQVLSLADDGVVEEEEKIDPDQAVAQVRAMFAGGDLSPEQKTAHFDSLAKTYYRAMDRARIKRGESPPTLATRRRSRSLREQLHNALTSEIAPPQAGFTIVFDKKQRKPPVVTMEDGKKYVVARDKNGNVAFVPTKYTTTKPKASEIAAQERIRVRTGGIDDDDDYGDYDD